MHRWKRRQMKILKAKHDQAKSSIHTQAESSANSAGTKKETQGTLVIRQYRKAGGKPETRTPRSNSISNSSSLLFKAHLKTNDFQQQLKNEKLNYPD